MSEASTETLDVGSAPLRLHDEKTASTDPAVDASDCLTESDGSGETPEFQLPGADRVALVRTRWRRWSLVEGKRLHNNLAKCLGLLEFANACDFAANVWNEVPVPKHAIVLMALGATFASVMAVVALRDAQKAWRNMSFLRRQQKQLEDEKQHLVATSQPVHGVDVLIEMTRRELWIETVVRWAMDVFQGGGAVPIAIGTYMAIGGANRSVFYASNILSGYVGNAPIALYGLFNATLAVHVWRKMHSHKLATKVKLPGSPTVPLLQKRFLDIQCFYVVNGIGSVVGGAGSLVAATMWWGYVILLPVVIAAFFCNSWWRRRIGYTRPNIEIPSPAMTADGLVRALESTVAARHTIHDNPLTALQHLVPDSGSLPTVLSFFVRYDLLEAYCLRVVNDKRLSHLWIAPRKTVLSLGTTELLALPESYHQYLLQVASEFIQKEGADRFMDRQRFLAEILGIYISTVEEDGLLEQQDSDSEVTAEQEKATGKSAESIGLETLHEVTTK